MTRHTPAPPALFPAGLRVALAPSTSFRASGRVATGGAPWGVARFKEAALPYLAELRRAGPGGLVPGTALGRALARQLVDRGLAHPVPASRPGPHPVTVVVPAYGRAHELDRCLGALHGLPVVVVDDGSPDAGPVREAAERHGARLVRHDVNRGPAAARNTGAALADTPLVAFVDSDCRPADGCLDILVPSFDDPKVAAVAPRIVPDLPLPPRGLLARYEAARSALDLGRDQDLVRPRARVGFVPTATLVVRRDVLRDVAFDEELRLGEDVDFVWRLHDRGLHVRYQPRARVAHTPRLAWRAAARRRHEYGTSAAALARRHPGRLAPVRPSVWNLLTLAFVAQGRPRAGAVSALVSAGLLRRRLAGTPGATGLSVSVVAQGLVADASTLGLALRREWWPLGLLCLATAGRSRLARSGAVAMLAPLAAEWVTRGPRLGPVPWAVLRCLDDLAYGTGVTASALRHRSLAVIAPRIQLPFTKRTDDRQTG
ncbi:mycofactocin biosynthesis glycosyltransferase MftF [Streptomyces sp. NBS 14/10]|uniref:mycofactocin biosynthesis glycosyltransferase MftF n=1 Tax=Streptomyces sp. NBS 14/10 TaxID=1945643 RepID=UPI0015C68CDF|nr:mycofactocin biosynthesis glycosyltransferase MftF [Streptomyces sp. NBS 14/10]KAK1185380.1 mycofactocin biosynthesis glycosyltransferase MftF [Streptomyces sp. NBS 14/10]